MSHIPERTSFAGSIHTNAYFGVDAQQSIASVLPVYRASAVVVS